MSKTILITGASSGLGKATAKLFAAQGWNVLATMRNPDKEAELTQIANVTVLPLDVTNAAQVSETIQQALTTHDVDVVFNNAGYGLMGPLEALSDEKIQRQFDTNVFGVMRVAREFIPFFKKKRSGRFITTTSLAGLISMPLNSAYNATKWALEGWSEAMAYDLAAWGIQVKTVAPGVILTDFGLRSMDAVAHPDYEQLGKDFIAFMMADTSKLSQPEQIAQVVYEAATDDKNQVRYIAGKDAEEMYAARLVQGNEHFRIALAGKLSGRAA